MILLKAIDLWVACELISMGINEINGFVNTHDIGGNQHDRKANYQKQGDPAEMVGLLLRK